MKKVLFLNAPPRAGKDAIGSTINRIYRDSMIFKFANMLKDACHTMVGLGHVSADYFENCKEKPNVAFPYNPDTDTYYSPREFYICVSEKMIKPNMSEDFFGVALTRSILNTPAANGKLIVITDSGFEPEAHPLANEFGIENCLLVHIHREGCDFKNDSRDFWSIEGMDLVTVKNDELGGVALESIARGLLTECGVRNDGEQE